MASGDSSGKGRHGYQFGWFKGVYTPSVLTILGVVMYLRFGWVLGNVGLVGTLVIVTISTAITFLTGLSLAALATNMRIEGGGAYYIISRSLGVEVGAAVGLPLYFAQALGISFYIAGFAESVVAVFPNLDLTLVGIGTLLVLTLLAYRSADLALKTQFIVMALIFASLVSFFCGSGSEVVLSETAQSELPAARPFWAVFAVFFPAVTGIEAGIAMSGDLKSPARALPRGTIAAVATGYLAYLAIPLFLSFSIANTEILRHESMSMVMQRVAVWGKLITAGVWAASLSSAMGALLGAPRTLQALARDRVIPTVFGRGFGKSNDPRIATGVSFLVGLIGIVLGDLNAIAPVLSMFFLTSYGLLNISAGLEELTGPPSWRPKFRVPCAVSFAGAFACFAAMFMINAGATFVAGFVAVSVYFLMQRRSIRAWWGDMRSGVFMLIARHAIFALERRKPDARTWKPNILVLSGTPTSRWHLIGLASAIARNRGFLTVASILPRDTPPDRVDRARKTIHDYLDKQGVESLVKVCSAATPLDGAVTLARNYGYGPIVPNTILLGVTEREENYRPFAELIRSADDMRQNLVVVREKPEEEAHSGVGRIDVWWAGAQKNLGLMLALVHLLRQGGEWRQSQVVLKRVVDTADKLEEEQKRLREFIDHVRFDAEAEVFIGSSTDVFASIREQSRGASLTFIGMRAPGEDESTDAYSEYYADLLRRTKNMPPTAFVLAAEEIEFQTIFRQSEQQR